MKTLNEQISKIKKIMGIHENKQTYSYGCVMLYFDELSNDIHSMIDHNDLYIEGDGFGVESQPHCTLLYGLHHNVTDSDIKNVLNKYTYGTCKGYNLSCFNNEKYDVLKFDILGDNLHDTNKELKQFPYTTEYPDYHPHMTVAYFKPGLGKKYIDMMKDKYGEIYLKPKYAVFSKSDGSKIPIEITKKEN